MQDVLAITLSAMQQDAARLDRVSANIANATTPGYKREVFVQRPTADNQASFALAVAAASLNTSAGRPAERPVLHEGVRDLKVGTLKSTRQPLDLALSGPGYFEVATDTGPAFTRTGQFQLDARGRLVTPQGLPVMGLSGDIVLRGHQPTIDAQGNVTEDGQFMGQLKIVDFERGAALAALEGGLFTSAAHPRVLGGGEAGVRQGFLENSNVNTTHEMVQLMQTMRHFESLHRTVNSYDEMVGSAIRKLGDL